MINNKNVVCYRHLRGDYMKIKNMALVGMGMLSMLAIEKYGVPMAKEAKKVVSKTAKDINNKIDQMM